MLKNYTLKTGTFRTGLYGSAPGYSGNITFSIEIDDFDFHKISLSGNVEPS